MAANLPVRGLDLRLDSRPSSDTGAVDEPRAIQQIARQCQSHSGFPQ